MTTVQATAVSEGVAYHGSTYPLEAGWNTLSVPLALSDSADTLSEIAALGDFLVLSGADRNYDGGFYYDGTLWQPIIASTYEFQPGAAVYIKMVDAADIPILFSGVFSLPSVSLPAGWNLVGSMFGIEKTIDEWAASTAYSLGNEVVPTILNGFRYVVTTAGTSGGTEPISWPTTAGNTVVDGGTLTWTAVYGDVADYGIAATTGDSDGKKKVNVALASLGASASVVISPSMPGQTAVWATVASSDKKMFVGEGYWVFMVAPATYAGFEVTPIYWINLP